jgi:uncharacterized coiled-coil protein SlyX
MAGLEMRITANAEQLKATLECLNDIIARSKRLVEEQARLVREIAEYFDKMEVEIDP